MGLGAGGNNNCKTKTAETWCSMPSMAEVVDVSVDGMWRKTSPDPRSHASALTFLEEYRNHLPIHTPAFTLIILPRTTHSPLLTCIPPRRPQASSPTIISFSGFYRLVLVSVGGRLARLVTPCFTLTLPISRSFFESEAPILFLSPFYDRLRTFLFSLLILSFFCSTRTASFSRGNRSASD
jgi:hypothetical protein